MLPLSALEYIPKPFVKPVHKTGKHLLSLGCLKMKWFICCKRVVITNKEVEEKTITLEHMTIQKKYLVYKPLRFFGENIEALWCIGNPE